MTAMTPEAPARPRTGSGPVIPVFLIGLGAYLAWFAIHYWRDQQTKWPSDPIKDVLQGKGIPAPVPSSAVMSDISGAASGPSATSGTVLGTDIASDAEKYKGHVYLYGGAPGTDGTQPWDCSSFCNWVIGHDMKLSIPLFDFGSYNGSGHGPATGTWLLWTGAKNISRSSVQPGDLCIWQTHMGIAISNTQMISATGPDGTPSTVVGNINQGGPAGEQLVCRRLNEVTNAQANQLPGSGTYTHAKLESLWRLAGGSSGAANTAAAVAQAESQGRTNAQSSNPDGGTNVGLWQLDTKGKGAGYSVAQLLNALTNARLAVKGSANGTNWSAWSTYTSGAYQRYLT